MSERNLTFIVIYNASHMVPIDSPEAALDLFNRLLGIQEQRLFTSSLDGTPSFNPYASPIPSQQDHESKPTFAPTIPANDSKAEPEWGDGTSVGLNPLTDGSYFTATIFLVVAIALTMGVLFLRKYLRKSAALRRTHRSDDDVELTGWREVSTVDDNQEE